MATILVTHGIPAEGFSLLSGEKIVIRSRSCTSQWTNLRR